MREDVVIVLNEREPSKAKVAESLEQRFKEQNITVSRIPVDARVHETIRLRQPKVLILDYLLGDFMTGLDVLSELENLATSARPKTIFLTDESSLAVVSKAFKFGILDFVEIDSPHAVNLVVETAKDSLVRSSINASPTPPAPKANLEDLIFSAPKSRQLLSQAQSWITRGAPLAVVVGDPGSGVSAFSTALISARSDSEPAIAISLRTFLGSPLTEFFTNSISKVGRDFSLLIEDMEEDTGEIIQFVGANINNLWSGNLEQPQAHCLVVSTHDAGTARAWSKLTGAELFAVAPLSERLEDIAPLVQKFVRQAENLSGQKIKPLSADIVKWLSQQNWTQHVRELRAVVINAALADAAPGADLISILEAERSSWEDSINLGASLMLDPIVAAAVLNVSGHDYRLTAAKLGCSVPTLRALLAEASA